MTLFERWDVILVPFPFTDLSSVKRRPAVVLSPSSYNESGDVIIGFITSKLGGEARKGDHRILDIASAGLPLPSMFRLKVATISKQIAIKKLGRLGNEDMNAIHDLLMNFLAG